MTPRPDPAPVTSPDPRERVAHTLPRGEAILADQDGFERALSDLARLDPRLAPILAATGAPRLRRRAAGFAGLAGIVIAQQVSAASARAIEARLTAVLGGEPDAARVLAAGEAGLRAGGLSTPKIRTLAALARSVDAGNLDFERLHALPSPAARAALVALPGIGPWTAEVYLLFALGRADAFPAGDLAVQIAAAEALGHPERLAAPALEAIAEDWRPLRGVAAQLLWAYYASRRAGRGAPPA
ncbi:DNA-3-methyladenine glycosylase family protein [Ancylobacter terrae]|uniref:DNA-3-methyladenine glycosylase family protein n=1 Tax=Ancylobacter sp. sgz301288 TaxID=3342077 RepID=UPI00385ADB58